MKRTILVVAVAAAIVLATAACAYAATETVNVSANVNPAFTMTLDSDGAVQFGNVDVGNLYAPGSEDQVITVKSNKLWDYSSTHSVITVGAATFPFTDFLTDTGVPDTVGMPRGVMHDTRSYTLDLTADHAYDIPAQTPMTASITYTAVQQ